MRGRGKVLLAVTAFFALCVFVATAFADSPPAITTDQPVPLSAATAKASGSVNPEGGPSTTTWRFEYTKETKSFFPLTWGPGPSGEISGTEAEQTTPVPVEGTIEGLEGETEYAVRMVAENEGEFGPNRVETPQPYPTFTTPAGAPEIQGVAVEPLATEALLQAEIVPGGKGSYRVEYGPTAGYGHSTASSPITSGHGPVPVKVGVLGLAPNTIYHARLVVENSVETVRSADQEFTTKAVEASSALPDGRVYEQVSPQSKNGNDAGATSPASFAKYAIATADGNGIFYGVRGAMGIVHRGLQDYAIGRRGTEGWSSESAIPSGSLERIYAISYAPHDVLPSNDLSKVVFGASGSYVPDNPITISGSSGLYMGHADGTVDWLTRPRIANPNPAPGNIPSLTIMQPVGASPDLSTVYFWSGPTLLPQDAARGAIYDPTDPAGNGPYGLYEYTEGVLKEAGTLPDGTDSAGGAAPAASGSTFRVSNNFTSPDLTANQVSRDGSTLWFVSPDPGPNPALSPPAQLYVRKNGRSTLVSHDQSGAPAPSGAAPIQAYYPGADPIGHQYAFGSPDGSHAIFQSVDPLTEDAPADGSLKAYMYDASTDKVTYLPGVVGAPEASSDDGQRFLFGDLTHISLWDHGTVKPIASVGAQQIAPARATASGSAFLFSTQAAIPGFNNGGGANIQIYRYEPETDKTTCLSCPPAGVTPSGDSGLQTFAVDGQVLPNRAMSTDGDRVFFDTPNPLVPRDTNGHRDVYEWTPAGVSLISTGRSKEDSFFLDNSADGNDVFFATTEGLVPADTDGGYDVYDARVGGGFARADEAAPCAGEACQGPLSSPPGGGGVGSARLRGAGNVHEPPKAAISGVRKISASDLAKLAKGGKAHMVLKVNGPGNVNLRGTAKTGRKSIRAVSSSAKAKRAGQISIPFALSRNARSALDRQGRLAVSVTVRFKNAQPKVVKFTVRAAGGKKGGGR